MGFNKLGRSVCIREIFVRRSRPRRGKEKEREGSGQPRLKMLILKRPFSDSRIFVYRRGFIADLLDFPPRFLSFIFYFSFVNTLYSNQFQSSDSISLGIWH